MHFPCFEISDNKALISIVQITERKNYGLKIYHFQASNYSIAP